jgi:hypothetical protein
VLHIRTDIIAKRALIRLFCDVAPAGGYVQNSQRNEDYAGFGIMWFCGICKNFIK